MEDQLEASLHEAVNVLEKNGYRYALIGGMALLHWGRPRYTRDIDIKVLVHDLDYKKIRSLLTSEFPVPARPHAPQNSFIVARIIKDVTVDFMLTIPGYEEGIIERAVRRDIGGWQIWICSAEDLIIQKIVAGRGKDIEDVQYILVAQYGRLDDHYIKKWLTEFEKALENPNLKKIYKDLVDKAKKNQRAEQTGIRTD